jgi:hypothetical protein
MDDDHQNRPTKVLSAATADCFRLRRKKTEWCDGHGEVVLLDTSETAFTNENSPSSLRLHEHEPGEQEEEDEEIMLQKGEENEAANGTVTTNEAVDEAIAREFQLE